MTKEYELGKQAYLGGKTREPMKDHAFKQLVQNVVSATHHPSSPGASMNESQRRNMEKKLLEWKRGWDEERAKV